MASATGFILFLAVGGPVVAAEPSPLLLDPLDPRAEGEGPGLVGDPLLALVVVLVLALLAAGAAAIYARLSQR